MRRFVLLVLALCLLAAPALAEDAMADRAVALGVTCDAICSDEGYVSAMVSTNNGVSALIADWAAGNHDQPKLIVRVDTTDLLNRMLSIYGADGMQGLSDAAMTALSQRVPLTLPSQFNAAAGAETLAASSIATASVIFASDAQGTGLYILLYEHAVPVMAAWYAENGAASMQATFVAQEELAACQSAEDVAAWFLDQGWELPCETVSE